jgi:hypothetical protein
MGVASMIAILKDHARWITEPNEIGEPYDTAKEAAYISNALAALKPMAEMVSDCLLYCVAWGEEIFKGESNEK